MNSLMVRNFVKFKLCDLISCCGQLPMFFLLSSSPLSPPPSPFSLILPFSPIPFYVRSHVHQNAERSHGKRYSRDERYHTSHLCDHAIIFFEFDDIHCSFLSRCPGTAEGSVREGTSETEGET